MIDAVRGADIDIKGFSHILKDNDIRHIDKSHGSKSNDKYKVTEQDIAEVQRVIEGYHNLYQGYDTKSGNPTIVYEYADGNRLFYVEEVLDAGGLSSKQMIIAGANSKPSFLKKYKKSSADLLIPMWRHEAAQQAKAPSATTSKTQKSLLTTLIAYHRQMKKSTHPSPQSSTLPGPTLKMCPRHIFLTLRGFEYTDR